MARRIIAKKETPPGTGTILDLKLLNVMEDVFGQQIAFIEIYWNK